MAKLPRIPQKVFASQAGTNQVAVFGSLAAGSPQLSSDPTLIQSLPEFLEGWYSAVVAGNSPTIEDTNALFLLLTRQLAYMFQQGIPEYDAQTLYYESSFVQSGGTVYRAIYGSPEGFDGVAPPNGSYWTVFGQSGSDVAAVWGQITGNIADQTDLQTELAEAGSTAVWGNVTGTLADQSDLQAALDAKAPLADPTFTGSQVALTGTQDLIWSGVGSTGGNIGVRTGQTSGTDRRPINAFIRNHLVVGNVLGLNPPYGLNNTLIPGTGLVGDIANAGAYFGANSFWGNGSESQTFYGFGKDPSGNNVPAFVNLATSGSNFEVMFSLLRRTAARIDYLRFGQGDMQFMAGSNAHLTWYTDGAGRIGSPGGSRPDAIYAKSFLGLGSSVWPAPTGLELAQFAKGDGTWSTPTTNAIQDSPLTGTYSGAVYVGSSCTLSGATTILGDLYVDGDLTNPGGYALTVKGDLRVIGALNFTTTGDLDAQGDLTVDGDLYLGADSEFKPNKDQAPALIVGGSILSTKATLGSPYDILAFDGSGKNAGAAPRGNGLSIIVHGDSFMVSYNLNGASTTWTNGGTLFVYGTLLGNATARGGDRGAGPGTAGAGGYIYATRLLQWDANIPFDVSGGSRSANDGIAGGPAGTVEVYDLVGVPPSAGDHIVVDARGGNGRSVIPTGGGAGGAGGSLILYGTWTHGQVYLNGGEDANGVEPGGDGGSVSGRGNVQGGAYLNMEGGAGSVQGASGSAEFWGNCNFQDVIGDTLTIHGILTSSLGGAVGTVVIDTLSRLGSLGVANAQAAAVAVGTLTKKIEVFDQNGSSLGFVPVYDSIT